MVVQTGGRTKSHCAQGQAAQTVIVSSDTFRCLLHRLPALPVTQVSVEDPWDEEEEEEEEKSFSTWPPCWLCQAGCWC